ncbi:MAG: BTAD domain-containing putative transcriptional regulator [Anaerolineae bacterium]|nr:BTAD domain-containing putative transcriptional regulator [Anaerolineae bacterium]
MLKINLFGTGQATYKGQALPGFPTQQASLLFCYLLLNPHSHHRERLAAVFWPDLSADASRKNLSQTLWRLRHTCKAVNIPDNAYLLISNDHIAVDTAGDYWLDTEVFAATINRYQDITGPQLRPDQAEELDQAVQLYTGELLEGIYQDWCLYDRERLNLMYLDTLGKLMIFHERNSAYELGLNCGEKILAYDNTRERIHQQMMRLHWMAGNRSAALAQYKRCVQILRDELGIAPMLETTQLHQQMISNSFSLEAGAAVPTDTAFAPLVQSDESLRQFAEHSLQRLTRLQAIMEETSLEIRSLERLIKHTLLDSSE